MKPRQKTRPTALEDPGGTQPTQKLGDWALKLVLDRVVLGRRKHYWVVPHDRGREASNVFDPASVEPPQHAAHRMPALVGDGEVVVKRAVRVIATRAARSTQPARGKRKEPAPPVHAAIEISPAQHECHAAAQLSRDEGHGIIEAYQNLSARTENAAKLDEASIWIGRVMQNARTVYEIKAGVRISGLEH